MGSGWVTFTGKWTDRTIIHLVGVVVGRDSAAGQTRMRMRVNWWITIVLKHSRSSGLTDCPVLLGCLAVNLIDVQLRWWWKLGTRPQPWGALEIVDASVVEQMMKTSLVRNYFLWQSILLLTWRTDGSGWTEFESSRGRGYYPRTCNTIRPAGEFCLCEWLNWNIIGNWKVRYVILTKSKCKRESCQTLPIIFQRIRI